MQSASQSVITMPEFLAQVGREFDGLSHEIEQFQETLSELLANISITPQLMEQAQALDHVFQHMAQLGAIMERVSQQSSPEWRMTAEPLLAKVSLSALAGRLSGGGYEEPASGEMEMF